MKLFIAFTSKDPFALYKSVETLKPDTVILINTAMAIKENWHRKVLNYLEKLSLKHYSLDISEAQNEINKFLASLKKFFNNNSLHLDNTDLEIICDQTNGIGLLRASTLMFFDNFTKNNKYTFYISFADPDNDVIRLCKVSDFTNKIIEKNIELDLFQNKDALEEYCSLYANSDSNHVCQKLNLNRAIIKEELEYLKIFKEKKTIRFLFTSWLDMVKQESFLKVEFDKNDYSSFYTRMSNYLKSIKDQINNENITTDTKNESIKGINSLKQFFESDSIFKKIKEEIYVNGNNYLSSILRNRNTNHLEQLVLGKISNEQEIYKIKKILKSKKNGMFEIIYKEIKDKLNKNYEDYKSNKDDKDSLINNYLQKNNLMKMKVFFEEKIGFGFEKLVGIEIERIIQENKLLKDWVRGVYTGLKIFEKQIIVLESDIVVVFKNGKVLIFEVKTNCEKAKEKDMNSRVKNVKDLLGNKSEMLVVYPFLKKELDYISSNSNNEIKEGYYENIWKYGLPQKNKWQSYFKFNRDKNDRKIIGFDELEYYLMKKIKR